MSPPQELCDFGFAVHRELQYLPDKVRGTPKFYAPELRRAAQKANSRSAGVRQSARGTEPPVKRPPADSFSFGALIQEAVFGEVSGQQTAMEKRWLLSLEACGPLILFDS